MGFPRSGGREPRSGQQTGCPRHEQHRLPAGRKPSARIEGFLSLPAREGSAGCPRPTGGGAPSPAERAPPLAWGVPAYPL
eukprot:12152069-Heterocapsa_arctica.AAC.1